jgi:GAF domain-containing protein
MVNSDAALDLGSDPAAGGPRLRQCVSAPIALGNDLLGVLTVYAAYAFSEPEQGLIETLAEELAPALSKRSSSSEGVSKVVEFPARAG